MAGITQTYHAHGKLLLTGEYVVLDGVPAFAVPIKGCQYLDVTGLDKPIIEWKSYDADGSLWFSYDFDLSFIKTPKEVLNPIAHKLLQILCKAYELNPDTQAFKEGVQATTRLDFDRAYGLGTSSTLISLVAQWVDCDPYALQFACFGGSGYDIACATALGPVEYIYHERLPVVKAINWHPSHKKDMFFVYLNRKQDSREAMARFNPQLITPSLREELIAMPEQFRNAQSIADMQDLMRRHEAIIGALIDVTPIQERLFPDYTGAVKSLGGWGGDFILAVGDSYTRDYFISKGYEVIYSYDEIIL